ncbi:hypothetical protein [Streptomyces sp. G45]|uniref:hypothetical protein n=1 Tax=Streptomyces sp. G45 TaxID=3406627 RepID=UPI003C28E868
MLNGKRLALGTAALLIGGGLMASGPAPTALAHSGGPAGSATVADPGGPDGSAEARRPHCPWPYICFAKGGTRLGMYRAMGYKPLTARAKRARTVINARPDDGARVHLVHRGGATDWTCVKPRKTRRIASGWKPYAVDIRNSPNCR